MAIMAPKLATRRTWQARLARQLALTARATASRFPLLLQLILSCSRLRLFRHQLGSGQPYLPMHFILSFAMSSTSRRCRHSAGVLSPPHLQIRMAQGRCISRAPIGARSTMASGTTVLSVITTVSTRFGLTVQRKYPTTLAFTHYGREMISRGCLAARNAAKEAANTTLGNSMTFASITMLSVKARLNRSTIKANRNSK